MKQWRFFALVYIILTPDRPPGIPTCHTDSISVDRTTQIRKVRLPQNRRPPAQSTNRLLSWDDVLCLLMPEGGLGKF
jgi:hypothetical protein